MVVLNFGERLCRVNVESRFSPCFFLLFSFPLFPQAVAEKTADNIKERQAQAKEVAGELINKTLADPELPKKVGGFLTGILAGKRQRRAKQSDELES